MLLVCTAVLLLATPASTTTRLSSPPTAVLLCNEILSSWYIIVILIVSMLYIDGVRGYTRLDEDSRDKGHAFCDQKAVGGCCRDPDCRDIRQAVRQYYTFSEFHDSETRICSFP